MTDLTQKEITIDGVAADEDRRRHITTRCLGSAIEQSQRANMTFLLLDVFRPTTAYFCIDNVKRFNFIVTHWHCLVQSELNIS